MLGIQRQANIAAAQSERKCKYKGDKENVSRVSDKSCIPGEGTIKPCECICVYTCVHVSNGKGYLCCRLVYQTPEVADRAPKMKPSEWLGAGEGDFGSAPPSVQN